MASENKKKKKQSEPVGEAIIPLYVLYHIFQGAFRKAA